MPSRSPKVKVLPGQLDLDMQTIIPEHRQAALATEHTIGLVVLASHSDTTPYDIFLPAEVKILAGSSVRDLCRLLESMAPKDKRFQAHQMLKAEEVILALDDSRTLLDVMIYQNAVSLIFDPQHPSIDC